MSKARPISKPLKYRFRGGNGNFLALVVLHGDKAVVAFCEDEPGALVCGSVKRARLIRDYCAAVGAPVVVCPFHA